MRRSCARSSAPAGRQPKANEPPRGQAARSRARRSVASRGHRHHGAPGAAFGMSWRDRLDRVPQAVANASAVDTRIPCAASTAAAWSGRWCGCRPSHTM